MTHDDILQGLFGQSHGVSVDAEKVASGTIGFDGRTVHVVGIVEGTPLGIEPALTMARHVGKAIEAGGKVPILVLVHTASQRMRRRDEMLGLDEYLAHLAKSLILAADLGHPTVGLLYGNAAAGAFIATALATRHLVALPDAHPSVMDLPSIARVTKQPLEKLKRMAETTPVFAPGLDHLAKTGAIQEIWDPDKPLAEQLSATLAARFDAPDARDRAGREKGGRKEAAGIAERVADSVLAL